MARDVYSHNLFRAETLSGATSETVPAGFTWVIRDVSLVHRGTTFPAFASITIPISLNLVFVTRASTADPQFIHLEGRWVLEQGDIVTFSAGSSSWDFYVSGYVLTLP